MVDYEVDKPPYKAKYFNPTMAAFIAMVMAGSIAIVFGFSGW